MLIYILSDATETVCVFLSITEAQQNYIRLFNQSLNVTLKEFSLDNISSKDLTIFLRKENLRSFDKNINKNKIKSSHKQFSQHFLDTIDECDNCGEDCIKMCEDIDQIKKQIAIITGK